MRYAADNEASHTYDVLDPSYIEDPYSVWNQLRQTCPVARSDEHGGSLLPTTWDMICEVAYDTGRFSSSDVLVLPPTTGNAFFAPPITSDPPLHGEARRILLPHFSPKAVEELRGATQSVADSLIDAIEHQETADAAADYSRHIPVRVIATMLDIPAEHEHQFLDWAIKVFQPSTQTPEAGRLATKEMLAYFAEVVEQRAQDPSGPDLISQLLRSRIDDAPLTPKHVLGTCVLLLMAGIDTTWSSLGASLLHLATHPQDRDRLVADPDLIPVAVEELLRAYAPVTMARVATENTELGGCPVSKGDRVLLSFPAGNRDPDKFPAPDEVIIDRQKNRHFAFGIGIHRCVGSNLARMELQVAISTWLHRFPNFSLAPGAEIRWGGTQVRGPREVPVLLR